MVVKFFDMFFCGSVVFVWDFLLIDIIFFFDGIRVFSLFCLDRIYDLFWNLNIVYIKVNFWCVEFFKSFIFVLCFFLVIFLMYVVEK